MGGANSVSMPGTHSNSDANTHTDPIVRSSKSSLSGKLVVEDTNMNLREDSSAPIKIDEDRGHATTVANFVLASLGSDSEHGDQSHKKVKRYNTRFRTWTSVLYFLTLVICMLCTPLIS